LTPRVPSLKATQAFKVTGTDKDLSATYDFILVTRGLPDLTWDLAVIICNVCLKLKYPTASNRVRRRLRSAKLDTCLVLRTQTGLEDHSFTVTGLHELKQSRR